MPPASTMTTQWMKSFVDHKVFNDLWLNTVILEATDAIGWSLAENRSGAKAGGE